MPTMSSGRLFAEMLKGYGVTHVFMVPAIFESAMAAMEDTEIRRITTHHEVAAAYMADGYARAAHKPGVCLAQSVGAIGMAAGLRDAYLACSPVIAVTGGPRPESRYRYLYQVIDDFLAFEPVTRLNAVVEEPERLSDLLRQAFRVATTATPGPVHLELPGRTGEGIDGEGDFELIIEEQFAKYPAHRPEPELDRVREAARILGRAERPVIVAGGGVVASGADQELTTVAELLSVPVAHSLNGKGAMPSGHPLCLGLVGTYGQWSTNRAVGQADVVFLAGSRAGGLTTDNWRVPPRGTTVIQLDINPAEIGRNYPVKVGLVGDAKVSLRRLIEAVQPTQPSGSRKQWVQQTQELMREWRSHVRPMMDSDAVPIRPERICKEISDLLPSDAVLVVDTGFAAAWAGTLVDLNRPRQRFIRCAGTLGWAFPASLGVKCALPDRPVMCFTGDGGMYYHLAELETAARAGINTVIVVNNNGSLRQIKEGIDAAYGGAQYGRAREMWIFKHTNFAEAAQTMGCLGLRVEHPSQLRGSLEQALAASSPVVVDVVSDIDAMPVSSWI